MILKGSQRGNAKELARHLLNGDTNEHVTVHDIKGFVSQDIMGALEEAHAISRGTRCKQFLFSLSLNPPDYADVPIDAFEGAIADIENMLGLIDQPRVIVFHEKNGRRHCHVVWSRIDSARMTALNMAYYKYKLMSVSKGLFMKFGWKLPKGFTSEKASVLNYTLNEWQQAQRLKEKPEALKELLGKCWQHSDGKKSFAASLQEYGFYLAKGDRRGFVVVDYQGEVYSLSRWLKISKKELKERLGDESTLPTVKDAEAYLQSRYTENLKQYQHERKSFLKEQRAPLVQELRDLTTAQRAERDRLLGRQEKRWKEEAKARNQRLSTGFSGIWERVTGKHQEMRTLNEKETEACRKRDLAEQHQLIQKHLQESKTLHDTLNFFKRQQVQEELRLKQSIAGYINAANEPTDLLPVTPVTERLAALETRIQTMSGDIALLQASLDNAELSDDMRAMIRNMIERAKEVFHLKQTQDEAQIKQAQELKEEELKQVQKKLYRLMQEHEELQIQQRQQEVNRGFYDTVMTLQYSLNGVPLHQIHVSPPENSYFNEKTYTNTLRQASKQTLHTNLNKKTTHTKEKLFTTDDLRESTLNVKEMLRRAAKKASGGAERHSKPKPETKAGFSFDEF